MSDPDDGRPAAYPSEADRVLRAFVLGAVLGLLLALLGRSRAAD